MIELFAVLAIGAAGAIARRYQGVAEETWPVKRTVRMLLVWPPIVLIIGAIGWLNGSPMYVYVLAALFPMVWAWQPSELGMFPIRDALNWIADRIPEWPLRANGMRRVTNVEAELVHGFLAAGIGAAAVVYI